MSIQSQIIASSQSAECDSLKYVGGYSRLVSIVGGCYEVGTALVRQDIVRGVQITEGTIVGCVVANRNEVDRYPGGKAYCILYV